jgi:hypothetical protein
VTDHTDHKTETSPAAPRAATEQRPPERELELKLKKNPEDLDSKTDVGSDESMDASDPIASTQPGNGEPAPSSTFPEDPSRN